MSPEQKTVAVVLLGMVLLSWVFGYLRDNVFAWSGAIDLTEQAPEPQIAVHVTGAVQAPGVYRLSRGSRVHDALAAAQGMTVVADEEGLNLASLLTDGQRVHVPERPPVESTEGNGAGPPDPRVNLNTASQRDLEALPGVGPQTAKRIVEFRKANGKFPSVDDLKKVPGIGDRTLERLRPLLKVR